MARGEVDGVPIIHGDLDGPVRACLMFAVGRRDEPLAMSGYTHLVEHLTLFGLGTQPFEYNGSVDLTHTRFTMQGDQESVIPFVKAVCAGLRSLPLERVADEARVLRVEEGRRGQSQVGLDLRLRFGARGPGVIGWQELGLSAAEPGDLQQWADQWFTSENAVLWLTCPAPSGLHVRLRQTRPPRRPDVPDNAIIAPTWLGAKTTTVSLSMVKAGTSDASGAIADELIRVRAFERLRAEQAISYGVSVGRAGLGDGRSLVHWSADGEGTHLADVLRGLSDAVHSVADRGPEGDELDTAKRRMCATAGSEGWNTSLLDASAVAVLAGRPLRQTDELIDEITSVPPDEVQISIGAGIDGLLAIGPKSLGGAMPGWASASTWSTEAIEGRQVGPVRDRETGYLVVGDDGIAWHMHASSWRSVRWENCVACLAWDSGARQCIGSDGLSVVVWPWAWEGGEEVVSMIDERVPRSSVIAQEPGSGPKAPAEPPAPAAAVAPPESQTPTEPPRPARVRYEIKDPHALKMALIAYAMVAVIPAAIVVWGALDHSVEALWIAGVAAAVGVIDTERRRRRRTRSAAGHRQRGSSGPDTNAQNIREERQGY